MKKIIDYALLKTGLAFMHTEVKYRCKACGELFVFQCDQDLDICSHCGKQGTATKEENGIIMRRSLRSLFS